MYKKYCSEENCKKKIIIRAAKIINKTQLLKMHVKGSLRKADFFTDQFRFVASSFSVVVSISRFSSQKKKIVNF